MIRKIFSILMIAVMVGAFVSSPVKAAQPVSFTSTFQLQNLTGSDAHIIIHFYDSTTGTDILQLNDTILPNDSNKYDALTDAKLPGSGEPPSGFKGSIMIESDQPVASISNLVGLTSGGAWDSLASYGGFFEGSPNAYIPLLMKNNYGIDTFFSVQNTGGANTVVTATYSDGKVVSSSTIKPGASYTFDQKNETHTLTVFSATLSTSGSVPIAVSVVQVGNSNLLAYNGFGSGSQDLLFPLVNQQPKYNVFSGITVQNVGGSPTDVTVTYTHDAGQPGTNCSETRTIAAGKAVIFSQFVFLSTGTDPNAGTLKSENCVANENFVGSGRVTANTASQPLVAVVNQANLVNNKSGAYSALSTAGGNQRVVFPLVFDRYYENFSSFSIMNVGNTTISKADVVCQAKGSANSGPVTVTINPTSDLAPYAGWTFISSATNPIGLGFVGGVTCTGPTGAKLVGISNELKNTGTIDTLLVYEGFSVTVTP